MEELNPLGNTMPGIMEVDIKTEVEEQFHAVIDSIKSENTELCDTKLTTLPGDYIESSPFSASVTQSSINICSPSRCRLCAIPDGNMTDIFGCNAMHENILIKINHCLPIVVKETDTLPKQVCRFCLEELERCYRFHKTVANAEKQLLAFNRLTSGNLEETKRKCETFPLRNKRLGLTKYDNVGGSLKATIDTEMRTTNSPENTQIADTTVETSVSLSSVWLTSSHQNPESTDKIDIARVRLGERVGNKFDAAVYKNKAHLVRQKKLHSCKYCEKKYTNREFRDFHHNLHTNERPFKCSVCEMTFTSPLILKRHAISHSEERKYPCSLCYKSFKTLMARKSHMAVHTDERPWECDDCKKHFKRKRTLAQHLVDCEKRPGTRELFGCNLCASKFKSKHNLSRHQKLHTGKGLHICDFCEKKFVAKADRDRHHLVHTGERPFKCTFCEEKFITARERSYHHLVHTGERPFKCSLCEKAFARSAVLRGHIATVHSDIRNYPCSLCDKSYKTSKGRKRHMSVHTDKKRTKLWQCDHCKSNCRGKYHLLQHVRICEKRCQSQ